MKKVLAVSIIAIVVSVFSCQLQPNTAADNGSTTLPKRTVIRSEKPGVQNLLVEYFLLDDFSDKIYNKWEDGKRYIYQCQGSVATPADYSQLRYQPSNDGWWDVDGNGYCGKLAYKNVVGGIAGFGLELPLWRGRARDISNWSGITFWACSDYGNDDRKTGPLIQVQIATKDGNRGWLGNYWHSQNYVGYNWQKYDLPFTLAFSPPIYDQNSSLRDALKNVIGIEFQQGIWDNKDGKNLQGNIYIDDVEFYR